MRLLRWVYGLGVLSGGIVMTVLAAQPRLAPELLSPPEAKFVPRFEAVAETKLLMEGPAYPHFLSIIYI